MSGLRIGIVSDLHADRNAARGHDVVGPLASQAAEAGVDRLLVAGDAAGGARASLRWLGRLRRAAACPVDFIPGNHDVWDDESSRTAYERLAAAPGCLAAAPRELPGGWVLVGDLGWYDYAFRHPSFSLSRIRSKRFGRFRWLDGYHARWQRSDPELARWFARRLEERLAAVTAPDPGGPAHPDEQAQGGEAARRRIVLVTHMVPYRRFLPPVLRPRWRFIQAYLGSPAYGELADRHSVAAVVFGHTHHFHRTRFRDKEIVCNPVGYLDREPVAPGRLPVQLEVLELPVEAAGQRERPVPARDG